MTLGSLFSGSGGFEFAGALAGIKPVWNAEIEPFPSRVTAARFPDVTNYGDVTRINGAEVQPVDIITFGSPCQDLSIAGKQAGIHEGKRSSLFFEAVRIITEMLESTNGKYPTFSLFENVPGMLTSNKGDDFRDVLQAFVDIKDPMFDVPKPDRWGGGRVVRYVLLRGRRYTIPKKTSRCRRTSTMLIRLIGYITLRTRPTVFSLRAVPVTVRFATWRGCRARTLTILLPYPNSGAARRKSSYLTQI